VSQAAAAGADRPPAWKIAAGFAVIYVVWGSTYLAIRIAVETLPPFTLAGLRWLTAGAILFTFETIRGRPRVTASQWLAAGIVGTLMLLGGNGLVCWAEQWVPSGLTALIIGTVPLWLILLDWAFFGGERPGGAIVLGLLLGSAGILILIGPSRLETGRIHLPGAIALLIACASWAFGSLYSRRANLPRSTRLASAVEMIAAGGVLLVLALAAGEWPRVRLDAISTRSLAALLYLLVAGSILALTTYLWLLRVSSPARVATYAYVNPVIAILLGTWLADEPFTLRIAVAAGVILTAVMVITRYGPRPRAPAHGGTQERPQGVTLPGVPKPVCAGSNCPPPPPGDAGV